MPAEATLDFVAEQRQRLQDEVRGVRDDMRVMAAMAERLDGTAQGFLHEVRAEHARYDRRDRRLRRLEETEQP